MKDPYICWGNIELIVFIKEISDGPRVGNIHHVVSICPDGTTFVKEIFVDPSTIMFHKKVMKSESFNNYFEFQQSFPEDAKLVHKYLVDEGIYPNNWFDKGYD